MNNQVVKNSIIHFDITGKTRLKIRLRILCHLWKRESIDSNIFNNTEDIILGIQIMLRNKKYSKKIIEQLEEQTLRYLFPEKSPVKYKRLHQRRYLLLQRLCSFIGEHAGASFVARYGHIEQFESILPQKHRELSVLEDSVLNFYDFLTSVSIKDIRKGNFYSLTK